MRSLLFQNLILLGLVALAGCQSTTPSVAVDSETARRIQMFDAGIQWNWSDGHLMRTTDGGQNWTDATPPGYVADTADDIYSFDAQTAWISTWRFDGKSVISGLQRTTDGGKTWTFFKQTFGFNEYHFSDANHGWAKSIQVSLGETDVLFFQTADGGQTWTPVLITIPDANAEPELPRGTIKLRNPYGDGIAFSPPSTVIRTFSRTLDINEPGIAKGVVRLATSTNLVPCNSYKFG